MRHYTSTIDWVQVESVLSAGYSEALIKLCVEADSRITIAVRAIFTVRGHGTDISVSAERSLHEGDNAIQAQITMHAPALWWPNGQGGQPLYDLDVRLEEAQSGRELDYRTIRFGIREVLWQPTEGAPRHFINPYCLIINGRPVRMMGSDVVPPDLLFGRIGERAPRLVYLAKAAG